LQGLLKAGACPADCLSMAATGYVSTPFVDLMPSHEPLRAELVDDLARLIESGAFTSGPVVAEFEAAFADYCGAGECVGMASGLDALRLALLALEIGPGDEVAVPAMTFAATFEAVIQAGATPVPVDISEADYCLDAGALAASISPWTRAVVPVHLYGQVADMAAIKTGAARYDLAIVEDACQAHGASRGDFRAGASGHAAAFSFYPSKNLGAFGDAGALVTGDAALATRARALRQHGETSRYHHELVGYTARLDTVQALVLLHKLPHLEGWNEERRSAAAFYTQALEAVGDLRLPPVAPDSLPVWHLYVVRTADPEALALHLRERSIGTGRHYPAPPHLMPAYASLGRGEGSFPVAEALAREGLSLPLFPGITEEQLQSVTDAVADFFRRG